VSTSIAGVFLGINSSNWRMLILGSRETKATLAAGCDKI
jgi:hypothetical protein